MKVWLLLLSALAAVATSGASPLFAWASHGGPATVNTTDALLRPFGDTFTIWTWRSQLAVVDPGCNVMYVPGEACAGETPGQMQRQHALPRLQPKLLPA